MKINIKEKLEKLENFLFKSHSCICCAGECDLDNDYQICSKCKDKIEFIGNTFCLKCGDKIGDGYDFCVNCKDTSYHFDYSRSVMCYDEVSAPIILRFKYNGYKIYKEPLAHLLFDYYKQSDIVVDCVTYVPMPETREKERGYNQAKELAVEFAKLSGLPLLDVLARRDDKIKQTTLSAEERKQNIKNSFCTINKACVKNKVVLLIDDVSTTGATSSECAKVLKQAKARSVCVLTVCKTPREINLLKS